MSRFDELDNPKLLRQEREDEEAWEQSQKEDAIVNEFLKADPIDQLDFWNENDEEYGYKLNRYLIDYNYGQIDLPLIAAYFYDTVYNAREIVIDMWGL